MRTRAVQLVAFAVLLCISVLAQKSGSERRFPLVRVNISGSQRYSNQAIMAYAGLRIGQQASQRELDAASQRLADSGLFSTVQYRFGWADGAVVNFDLSDNTQLVPIGFENLVWFSPAELTAEIKKKVPLFTGVVPLSGSFNEELREVLQKIIAARNLEGTVIAIPQGKIGEVHSMLYKVEGNQIKIADCQFPGADHADKLALFELTKYLGNLSYEKSFVNASVNERLKDIYDTRGYLAARFEEPEVRVLSAAPDHTELLVTTTVKEGPIFRFTGVHWTGNSAYTTDELDKALRFQPGQVASLPKFREDLDSIRKLYGKKGYMRARMSFTPVLNPDGTATFNVELHEGNQYRVGKVEFTGLSPTLLPKVMSDWQLKQGDIYDASYPQNFLTTHFGRYVPQPLRWEWRNREVIHDDTKVVDLRIEVEIRPPSK